MGQIRVLSADANFPNIIKTETYSGKRQYVQDIDGSVIKDGATYTSAELNQELPAGTYEWPKLAIIYTKDTHYIAGPNNGQWQVEDNFISAITGNGETLSVNDMTVTYGSAGQPDLSKAGTYTVTYSYTDARGNKVS